MHTRMCMCGVHLRPAYDPSLWGLCILGSCTVPAPHQVLPLGIQVVAEVAKVVADYA